MLLPARIRRPAGVCVQPLLVRHRLLGPEHPAVGGAAGDATRRREDRLEECARAVGRRGERYAGACEIGEGHPGGVIELESLDRTSHVMQKAGLHDSDRAEARHASHLRGTGERRMLDAEAVIIVACCTRRGLERIECGRETPVPDCVDGDAIAARNGSRGLFGETLEHQPHGHMVPVHMPLECREHASVGEQLHRPDPQPLVALPGGRTVQPGLVEGAEQGFCVRHHQHAQR